MMAFSGGLLYMCGPPRYGGRAGQPVSPTDHSCLRPIEIPGMPAMTCQELNPQHLGAKAVKIQMAEAILAK